MMHRKCACITFSIWAAVVALSVFLLFFHHSPQKPGPWTGRTSSISGPEDPHARYRYEFNRLKNPATDRIPENIRTEELRFVSTLPTTESLQKSRDHQSRTSLDWTLRGPHNVGGRTRSLVIDVEDENTILAGSVSGGMFRSTDAGAAWIRTTDPSVLHNVTCLIQDTRPGKTHVWYYGSGETYGNTAGAPGAIFSGNGVFKSTDRGRSWFLLASTATNSPHLTHNMNFIYNIVVDPSNLDEDEVYYAMLGGIRRSTDGGLTWTTVLGEGDSPHPYFTDIAVTSTGILYAVLSSFSREQDYDASTHGIFRSEDGIDWTEITPGNWPRDFRRTVIGIAPSDERIVYFLSDTPGSGFHGFLRENGNIANEDWTSLWRLMSSSEDGTTLEYEWDDRSANLPNFGGFVGDLITQDSYDIVVRVKPDSEDVVFVGGTNLYRSTDGFATADHIAWIGGYAKENNVSIYPNHYMDQHAITFLPSDPGVLYSGNDGGVQRTSDNTAGDVEWTNLNNGYVTSQFYTIAIDHSTAGSSPIIGGMQDNGTYITHSSDPLNPWTSHLNGDGAFCAITDGGNIVIASAQYAWILKSVYDNQSNLIGWVRIDPHGGEGYLFINPFVIDPNNSDIMYLAGGDVLWRNDELSGIPLSGSLKPTEINWTKLTRTRISKGKISSIGISKTPPNLLYFGTTAGQVFRIPQANVGNSTPIDISTEKGLPENANVSCILVDPLDAERVLVVFSNYCVPSLFYTVDGGSNWIDVSGNLEERPDGSGNGPSCRWAAMLHSETVALYLVGTSTGLYSTTMLEGASTEWALEGASTIGNVVVDMIDVRQTDGFIAVGTHGKGVYSAKADMTDVAGEPAMGMKAYSLEQNYPNPFNTQTTIHFTVPSSDFVTLKVYDLQGREIHVLLNEPLQPGRHSVVFDASGIPSGLYTYRLSAGGWVQSRKLIVTK